MLDMFYNDPDLINVHKVHVNNVHIVHVFKTSQNDRYDPLNYDNVIEAIMAMVFLKSEASRFIKAEVAFYIPLINGHVCIRKTKFTSGKSKAISACNDNNNAANIAIALARFKDRKSTLYLRTRNPLV